MLAVRRPRTGLLLSCVTSNVHAWHIINIDSKKQFYTSIHVKVFKISKKKINTMNNNYEISTLKLFLNRVFQRVFISSCSYVTVHDF